MRRIPAFEPWRIHFQHPPSRAHLASLHVRRSPPCLTVCLVHVIRPAWASYDRMHVVASAICWAVESPSTSLHWLYYVMVLCNPRHHRRRTYASPISVSFVSTRPMHHRPTLLLHRSFFNLCYMLYCSPNDVFQIYLKIRSLYMLESIVSFRSSPNSTHKIVIVPMGPLQPSTLFS